MKNILRNILIGALAIMLFAQFTACGSPASPDKGIGSDEKIVDDRPAANDKPTIPENVAEGIENLYDFRFSERYDDRITDDFSISLSGEASTIGGDTLFLFEKYQNKVNAVKEELYDGDGMVPYQHKRYWYSFKEGGLMVGTQYYEPDHVEYISYLWTDVEGAKTNQKVAVGSSEKQLLSAYTDHLYYLDKDEALSENGMYGIIMIESPDGDLGKLDEKYDFDCAYLWQPFTPETNEIRDIAFYIKDGKVAAIEMTEPFELRHVYGYDRDAGLKYTEEQRNH
jgi:hypothetical protein